MFSLTQQGYLVQPHLSAGRIPTRKAFSYYIENLLSPRKIAKMKKQIKSFFAKKNRKNVILKDLAKKAAELSHVLAIVASDYNYIYYTGLSYLFNQPEFSHLDLICDASEIIDNLDELVNLNFSRNDNGINILIGDKAILGGPYALISNCRYYSNLRKKIFFGLFGPMRMDYKKNIALADYISEVLLD